MRLNAEAVLLKSCGSPRPSPDVHALALPGAKTELRSENLPVFAPPLGAAHTEQVIAKLLPVGVVALLLAMPADASFPGANGLIAFSRSRGGIGNFAIDVVRPDGSGRANIVEHGSSPSWSQDGRRLVFEGGAGPDNELFVVNADGTDSRRIRHPGIDDFEPSWSPDGRRIAFTSRPNIRAAFEIYVVNANGLGRHRLTRNYMRDDSPAWSPDGTRIAFERVGSRGGIYSIRPNGRGLRWLTRARDSDPSWSPDGRLIAFRRFGKGVMVMNADGSNAHVVVVDGYGPAWSPDGTKLTFWIPHSFDLYLYVADRDGGNIVPLVANEGEDALEPDWQPLH
jgi:Tol biopolymer transport system component